jgi:ABC-type antimicrobial peptide transport system permease subunit
VAQRRQEIGLRSALGASPESLRTLVLGKSLRLAAIGIVTGIALAFFITRLLADTLATLTFGIGLADGLTYVAVPVLLALLALVASYLPAWSASRIDPVVALRQD